jgi:hypothetical protein
MAINKLTHTALRAAKPTEKPYKLSDGGGLYLLVNPSGALWWRFKYQFEGREKLLSLGVHPHVSLQQARALRDEAKKAVANRVDPSAKRQAEKSSTANSFEAVAREWLALQEKKLAPCHPQILSGATAGAKKYSWCRPPSTAFARTATSSRKRCRNRELKL